MGREIKCRGKRTDNKMWVYGGVVTTEELIQCGENGMFSNCYIIEFPEQLSTDAFSHGNAFWTHNEFIQIDPATVGQYTGLKDKNGVEIYEGDILRIPATNKYEEITYNSFEVFWHDNDCSPTDVGLVLGRLVPHGNSAGGYSGYKLIPRDVTKMIIIGNIHDNPELLESEVR